MPVPPRRSSSQPLIAVCGVDANASCAGSAPVRPLPSLRWKTSILRRPPSGPCPPRWAHPPPWTCGDPRGGADAWSCARPPPGWLRFPRRMRACRRSASRQPPWRRRRPGFGGHRAFRAVDLACVPHPLRRRSWRSPRRRPPQGIRGPHRSAAGGPSDGRSSGSLRRIHRGEPGRTGSGIRRSPRADGQSSLFRVDF